MNLDGLSLAATRCVGALHGGFAEARDRDFIGSPRYAPRIALNLLERALKHLRRVDDEVLGGLVGTLDVQRQWRTFSVPTMM